MDVRLPNGVLMKGVPEGTSKHDIMVKAVNNGLATPEDFGESSESNAWRIPPSGENVDVSRGTPVKPMSTLDYAVQGATAVPVMAAGGRALQLATRGSKVAPYTGSIANVLMPKTGKQLLFEGGLGATAGVVGGKVGEQFPEGWQRDLATFTAGTATALPFAFARNAADMVAGRGMGQEAVQLGQQSSQALGQARANAQAATAIRANPNLVPTVLRASEIEQRTGVSLPVLAAANGDTTISSYLQSQMARGENAEFAASMKTQYEAAEKALTAAKKGKAPSMQEVDTYVKRKAAEVAAANKATADAAAAASARRQQGLDNINTRIQEITSEVQAPGRLDVGTRLTNLLSAKESSIRADISPKYEDLIKTSMDAGIKLPGQSAQNLRSFAQDTTNDDVFSKFPTLYGKIKSVFRTAPVGEGTKAANKYTFARQAPEPKDIPLNTLDSLKRETNKALRDTSDKDQIRKLLLLKKEVDAAIDSVDPAFSGPYRALDKEYATRLGIPFNEQGVVNIDRAKFIEESVPAMTKHASSLKQTMAIVGDSPEGLKIVEDAFMYDISQNKSIINTNTGELNPAQLKRYIAQNKDKIDLVPGLRQKLESLGGRVGELRQNRTAIMEAEKNAQITRAENIWSQAYGSPEGLRGLVRKALGNPQQLDQLVSVTTKDKVAREGIKSAMLEDVLNAPGDRLQLFQDNIGAFKKIFGNKEADDLLYLVEASQRLKDNPFVLRINPTTISKTQYEQITGSRPDTTLGELRNQVLSIPRAVINHVSRYFQNQASRDEAAEVQRFLLDPKNLANTARLYQELETKGFTDKAREMLMQLGKNSSSIYLLGGGAGFVAGTQAPEAKPYQPTSPGLLQGFGQ
jgi:hypothetical protein